MTTGWYEVFDTNNSLPGAAVSVALSDDAGRPRQVKVKRYHPHHLQTCIVTGAPVFQLLFRESSLRTQASTAAIEHFQHTMKQTTMQPPEGFGHVKTVPDHAFRKRAVNGGKYINAGCESLVHMETVIDSGNGFMFQCAMKAGNRFKSSAFNTVPFPALNAWFCVPDCLPGNQRLEAPNALFTDKDALVTHMTPRTAWLNKTAQDSKP